MTTLSDLLLWSNTTDDNDKSTAKNHDQDSATSTHDVTPIDELLDSLHRQIHALERLRAELQREQKHTRASETAPKMLSPAGLYEYDK